MKISDEGDPNGDYFKCKIKGRVYPLGGKYPLGVRANSDGTFTHEEDSCDKADMKELMLDARRTSPGGMPPLLLEHCSETGPIGCVTDMWFEDDWLMCSAELHIPKALDSTREIRAKFKNGDLNGFSIGYDIVPNSRGPDGRQKRRFVEISAVKKAFFPNTFASVTASAFVQGQTYGLDPTGAIVRANADVGAKDREYIFSQQPGAETRASEVRGTAETAVTAPAPAAVPAPVAAAAAPVAAEAAAPGGASAIRVYTRAPATEVPVPAPAPAPAATAPAPAPAPAAAEATIPISETVPVEVAPLVAQSTGISKQQQPPPTNTPHQETAPAPAPMENAAPADIAPAVENSPTNAPEASDTPAAGKVDEGANIAQMMEQVAALEERAKAQQPAEPAADSEQDTGKNNKNNNKTTKRSRGEMESDDDADADADGDAEDEELPSIQMQMMAMNERALKELKSSQATIKKQKKEAIAMQKMMQRMIGNMDSMLAPPKPPAAARARTVKASRGAAAKAAAAAFYDDDEEGEGGEGGEELIPQPKRRRAGEASGHQTAAQVRASADAQPTIDEKTINPVQRCMLNTFGSDFLNPTATSSQSERLREIYNGN